MSRESRVVEEGDALAGIEPGMTIGVGGFINAGHPMALVRGLIRSGVDDLTVVGAASAGLEIDLLIAAGSVRKVITPYVGAEGLASIAPAFRKAAQDGEIEVFELDEAHHYAGLRAAAQRLPFNPWRAGLGTSYPEVNPALRVFEDPIERQPLIAVPAIEIDVCLLHASRSDAFGNVQHNGSGYGDRALSAAADRTVVEVEQLIATEQIRANPLATSIAGADLVVRTPYGSHPFGSDGYYPPDTGHIEEYLEAAGSWLADDSRERLDSYVDRYCREPRDHVEYLERVGVRQVLELSEY